jgi:hypothetical protein
MDASCRWPRSGEITEECVSIVTHSFFFCGKTENFLAKAGKSGSFPEKEYHQVKLAAPPGACLKKDYRSKGAVQ